MKIFVLMYVNRLKQKQFNYNIALLASIKYNLSVLSEQLTEYTSMYFPELTNHYHATQADESYRHAYELFELLREESNSELMYDAVEHGSKIVHHLLDGLAKIF